MPLEVFHRFACAACDAVETKKCEMNRITDTPIAASMPHGWTWHLVNWHETILCPKHEAKLNITQKESVH